MNVFKKIPKKTLLKFRNASQLCANYGIRNSGGKTSCNEVFLEDILENFDIHVPRKVILFSEITKKQFYSR